tara:strand:- start:303 stop:728 length:426 start_codon:yes stop_codon:yes gene_type:complete
MPIVPGTSHTVTQNSGVGSAISATKDPSQGIEVGRSILADDYTTLTIAQSAITEASPGVLTSTAHGLATGDLVTYHSEGGTSLVTSVGTVADGTEYYVERMSADTFELATSAANATAGTTLQITNDGNDSQTFRRPIGKVV